jgi:PAS domain S-box-containing protein
VSYSLPLDFRALVDSAPDLIAVFDRELRYVYVNAAVERAAGRHPGSFLGKTNRALGMPAELCERWDSAIRAVFADGRERRIEFPCATAQGERYFQSHLVPGLDAGGQVATVMAHSRDVTDVRARHSAEAAAERLRRLEMLAQALAAVIQASDVAGAVIASGRSALGAAAGSAWLVEDGALVLDSMQGYDSPHGDRFRRVPLDADMPVTMAARQQALVLVESRAEMEARFPGLQIASVSPFLAWAAVPCVFGGVTLAVVSLAFSTQRSFSEDDRALLTAMGNQAAIALERSRLFEAERSARAHAERSAARMQQLQAVTSRLSGAHETHAISQIVVEQGTRAVGAARGGVWLIDAAGEALELVAEHGHPAAVVKRYTRIPLHLDAPVCESVRAGHPLWMESRAEFAQQYPASAARLQQVDREGEIAMASLPLLGERGAVGVLSLTFEAQHAFDRTERDFLTVLADHCAQSLERARLFERERATRQTLQAIIAASPAAVMVLDMDGMVREWNPAAERIYGWTRQEVLGRFLPAVAEEQRQSFRDNLAHIAAGETIEGAEIKRLTRDRGVVDFELWAAPLRQADGSVQCLSIVVDISARKQHEQALLAEQEKTRAAYELAQAADRRKDEFLALLSHELRNPLAPIVTALELMQLAGPQQFERTRAVIERQVKHLVRLVDDLMDVSRITRGKVELQRRPIDIASVIQRAVEMVSPLLEQRQHALAMALHASRQVDGDTDRLAQVFANLLTNAARYTAPGGRVEVTARDQGGEVVIDVTDNGRGISAELLPRVFDLFVQGERGMDRSEGGLGLGLPLVRSLVELHGGSVSAHSDGPGRGSRLTVRLPAIAGPAGAASAVHEVERALHDPRMAGARVLVVDDNADAAALLASALRMHGCDVEVAHDGPSALEALRAFTPELAVLDLGLPVMDGYELAAALKGLPGCAHTRLIAVSGYGQESDFQRSRAVGFDEHLVKPITIEALASAVRRQLVQQR